MSFTLDLNKGTVKRDVAEIPNKMLEGAFEAIMDVAYLMLGIAQVRVRVDTGSLRDSGRVERGGEGKRWRQVKVRFGGYVVNPKTGRLVDYAAVVEQKYPYLKPAWEQVRGQVETIIRRCCLEHIREVVSAGVLKFP